MVEAAAAAAATEANAVLAEDASLSMLLMKDSLLHLGRTLGPNTYCLSRAPLQQCLWRSLDVYVRQREKVKARDCRRSPPPIDHVLSSCLCYPMVDGWIALVSFWTVSAID